MSWVWPVWGLCAVHAAPLSCWCLGYVHRVPGAAGVVLTCVIVTGETCAAGRLSLPVW